MSKKIARLKFIVIVAFLLVILLNRPFSLAWAKKSDRHKHFITQNIVNTTLKLDFASGDNSQTVLDKELLPLPQIHPLPLSLANWKEPDNQEDYFPQIKPTPIGYLIWSQFPVKVYLEKPQASLDNSAENLRQQQWIEAVRIAIAEWNRYLPLQEIDNRELADLNVLRSTPAREVKINPETGLYDLPRAITAQTTYQFYWQENKVLSHRMRIQVSPNLSKQATLAATRHELGHALGIWGHSPQPNDALYFSQVRDFPTISFRDINTLKKIYQQPTRLGWLGREKLETNLN